MSELLLGIIVFVGVVVYSYGMGKMLVILIKGIIDFATVKAELQRLKNEDKKFKDLFKAQIKSISSNEITLEAFNSQSSKLSNIRFKGEVKDDIPQTIYV